MTHRSHPKHPLVMVDGERRYKCDGCKMYGIGKRYTCKRCDFDLHPKCMFPSNTITIQGQECHFHEKPPIGIHCTKANCTKCRTCDACGMTIMGFVYHCPNTDWDFHPTCVKLENKISIEDVTFSPQKQGLSNCAWCKRRLLKGAVEKITGWSSVAEDEDYNLHVYGVMDMVMQLQGSSSNFNEGHTRDRDLSLALKGTTELPLKNKSKKVSKTNKWLKMFKVFIGTVFSILLGDPTTLIASTMAHLVVEGLSHAVG